MSAKVYRDTVTGFHRLNKMPLDDKEIFENVKDLLTYISSGTAYHGQRCVVKFPYFDQEVTLSKGRGDVLVPVFKMPAGYEWITTKNGSDIYALIYYYNGGSLFTDKNQQVRLTDSFAWGLLPHASLLACSDTNIKYLLEYHDDTGEHGPYTFTQANFCTNTVAVGIGNNINRISSESNADFIFPTPNSAIGIMPKTASNTTIRLWVKCNEYDAALGV